MARPQTCSEERDRLKKIFSDEFSTEPLTSQHCEGCGILARQMDSVRKLIKVYGNDTSIANKLNVAHTTVRVWHKKLQDGETLRSHIEARLQDLNPRAEWSKELLFGFDGAQYCAPALLAIHRCRMLGHLNITVKRFSSSAEMAKSLEKGTIHIAVMSKTLWDSRDRESEQEGATVSTVSTLVDIGEAIVRGIAGKQIANLDDLSGMTFYVPAKTALKNRLGEFFEKWGVRADIKLLDSSQAQTILSKADHVKTALIGSPVWVDECLGGPLSPLKKLLGKEIKASLMPTTPATLAYNKACPRAPLRLFLMSLDEVLLANPKGFLDSEDWDLGSKEANAELTKMIDFYTRNKEALKKLRRDSSFFSVVSLWNAEVQTLGRTLSGGA